MVYDDEIRGELSSVSFQGFQEQKKCDKSQRTLNPELCMRFFNFCCLNVVMIHPKLGGGFIYEKFKQAVPSISEPPLPFMYSCMTILKRQIKLSLS